MKNGRLSKTGNTSNKNQKRKAAEKSEDDSGSNNCSLETGERAHASNCLQLRKKARISSGDSEENESNSASEAQKGRVAGLQYIGTGTNWTESPDSIDNRCSKSTRHRNNNGDNQCSKPTRDKDSCGLSKDKELLNCKCLYGNVNYGTSNSASCCHTGPSSSAMLSSFRHGPAIQRGPVAVDRCGQSSVAAFGICNRARGANCKPNCQGCSVRGKGDDLVEAEDVEPTEESKSDFNDNCSTPSLESRKEVFTKRSLPVSSY